ncbi:Calcineurin-like phosphoesterase [Popillia japonica]|uniref:Calcineurin-like phosphoesterase n=1 Tax=Popillia japonica TaxID=7064 RepID=A0AAW1JYZ9_POPJA
MCRRDITYFWHITDIHLNPHFVTNGDAKKGCSRSNHEGHSRPSKRPVGRYGDYLCDAPWDLIESATKAMVSKQGDNVDFVLWTGDNLSSNVDKREGFQLHVLKNLTDLLLKTFTSQFVFPALGHDDPTLRKEKLGKIWSRWIPAEAMDTLETGGYYVIEIKSNKLRIIVLNTNLMLRSEQDEEASRQWKWLSETLEKIHRSEKVGCSFHIHNNYKT